MDQKTVPRLTIVILSCNRGDDIRESLCVLLPAARDHGYQIVVVDNGSADGTPEMLEAIRRDWPELHIVLNKTNLGIMPGRKLGFEAALAPYIVCLDDDAIIAPSDLEMIPAWFDRLPMTGILSFRVRHPLTGEWEVDEGINVMPVANFHAAGAAYRLEMLKKIANWTAKSTYGGEGHEMAFRARAVGYDTTYVPHIVVIHNRRTYELKWEEKREARIVYNIVRVNATYLPTTIALLYGWRYFLLHASAAFKKGRVSLCARLFYALIRGLAIGFLDHEIMPDAVVGFYLNPELRPNYGNAPLRERSADDIVDISQRQGEVKRLQPSEATSPDGSINRA